LWIFILLFCTLQQLSVSIINTPVSFNEIVFKFVYDCITKELICQEELILFFLQKHIDNVFYSVYNDEKLNYKALTETKISEITLESRCMVKIGVNRYKMITPELPSRNIVDEAVFLRYKDRVQKTMFFRLEWGDIFLS